MKSCLMRVDQDFNEFVDYWQLRLVDLGYKISKTNLTGIFTDILRNEDIENLLIVNKGIKGLKRIRNIRNENEGFDFKI